MNNASSGNSKLKLSLDLLRNGGYFEFVQPNISPVKRLEDDVASVRGWLGGIADQLEHVLVHLTLGLRLVPDEIILLALLAILGILLSRSTTALSAGIDQSHVLGTREEGITNFNLEVLILNRWCLSRLKVGLLLSQLLFVALLSSLVHDGLFGGLQLLILESKNLFEG